MRRRCKEGAAGSGLLDELEMVDKGVIWSCVRVLLTVWLDEIMPILIRGPQECPLQIFSSVFDCDLDGVKTTCFRTVFGEEDVKGWHFTQ